tara:strand:- start:1315 stop:1650 length:336 start_codon:yes stop_codon:yes gene_type:complete
MKTYNEYQQIKEIKDSDELDLFMEYYQEELSKEDEEKIQQAFEGLSIEEAFDKIEEGIFGSILGGIAGATLGKKVGEAIAAALGVKKGILYDLLTSRLLAAAIGAAVGKRI